MIENLQGEIWKVIDHPSIGCYPNYMVSNMGRVKSLNYKGNTGKEKILKGVKNKIGGYLYVGLYSGEKSKLLLVHRLVALMFVPNPDNFPQINHLDECKSNNYAYNLQWVSARENCNYASRNKRIAEKNGKKVFQYTIDRMFVGTYPSVNEAGRQTNFHYTAISACCLGKLKTAYGFIWSYEPLKCFQYTLFPLTETKVS